VYIYVYIYNRDIPYIYIIIYNWGYNPFTKWGPHPQVLCHSGQPISPCLAPTKPWSRNDTNFPIDLICWNKSCFWMPCPVFFSLLESYSIHSLAFVKRDSPLPAAFLNLLDRPTATCRGTATVAALQRPRSREAGETPGRSPSFIPLSPFTAPQKPYRILNQFTLRFYHVLSISIYVGHMGWYGIWWPRICCGLDWTSWHFVVHIT